MTSLEDQTTLVLGKEYDEQLRQALLDTLREFGAQTIDSWRGIGGSQDISHLEVDIEGVRIVVESETYIGLSISGDGPLIQRLAARVHERMSV